MTEKPQYKNHAFFTVTIFLVLIAFVYIVISRYQPGSTNRFLYRDSNFHMFDLSIPKNLTFCGEQIPMDNYEVGEKLKKEFFASTYWRGKYKLLYSKAERWFPYIEPILDKYKVPSDFKYVAVIESHLSNVYSPAGAAGFWQLVPVTARKYGLVVNNEIDERLDVEKSTEAACKLILAAYRHFNNWSLAAAAYNKGIAGIDRVLRKQKEDNYHDLKLNQETGEFLYRILAYKTILTEPKYLKIEDSLRLRSKIPVKSVRLDSSIADIKFFAKKCGLSVAQLKLFNPWLLGNTVSLSEKQSLVFKFPKNAKADYSAYYADLIYRPGYYSKSEDQATKSEEIEPKDSLSLTTTK